MSTPFRFKQFQVDDHLSTMKVGTDAVLLGAWSEPPRSGNILDIGTGCGVIALMMAQKSEAHITAIDIHEESVRQASWNFSQSPWKNRLFVMETSLEMLANNHHAAFDYVISNPPFFLNSLRPCKPNLLMAKHADTGFLDVFLQSISSLLKPGGKAAFIIAFEIFNQVLAKGSVYGIYPYKVADVYGKPGSSPVRVMLEVSHDKYLKFSKEKLFIYTDEMRYTDEYKSLTQDFYLFLNE